MTSEFTEDVERMEDYDNSEDTDDVEEIEEIEAAVCDDISVCENLEEAPSFLQLFSDDELFEENNCGEYQYKETEFGKCAEGELLLSDEVARSAYNQRNAGGEYRRSDDDGGHLIGNRFGGSSDMENLFPQNRNLNRGAYKALENEWEQLLEADKKVYVNIETYDGSGAERPNTVMGHYIVEDSDGKRTWEAFSFPNESKEIQEEWDELKEEMD